VTTIGGIIGKVVSIKDETFVLETTKERTHIRFLVSAIRSVDVKAEESARPRAAAPAQKAAKAAPKKEEPVEAPVAEPTEAPAEEVAEPTAAEALGEEK
ncbi:MAG: preprotein translocase subunit YajC, partial [Clostridia bacterium]|nr:preprotein translocase subunit YajC [Clostridia bacterium]